MPERPEPVMVYRDPNPVDGPAGRDLWNRADRVLPGGGIYRSRSADMAGRGVLPGFIAAAQGCHVVDADGRRYVDFLAANGPNILGYRHPEVEAAADEMRSRLTTASLFPPVLVEVVERLLGSWPQMNWGVVSKNGSEVVSLGARVARQHTGRTQLIGFARAYHGNDPELAVGTPEGPLTAITGDVHRLPWNGAQELVDHVAAHPDAFAAIVVNPLDQTPAAPTVDASEDFVAAMAEVRNRWGVLVVFDDVRHGFRLHPQGSHRLLGIEPDLIALGKALGNGHSISALLGRQELRAAARRIMFTSTYMFEAAPMAAAIATLDVYERDDAFSHITDMGTRLCAGLSEAATAAGQRIVLSGPVTMPTLLFDDDADKSKVRAFSRAAAGAGAIFHPFLNWFLSAAHTAADIDHAIEAAAVGFEAVPE
ncbi:MAG: aminotransferase class III-fold pyridoxal phosphate-dependent enzyme [Acidimicrobiales bacterium]